MGALDGVKVIELAGIGPGPLAGMILADMGADVLRIDRADAQPVTPGDPALDVLSRGRRSVVLDLKRPEGIEVLLRLVDRADVLIEGFRPGVVERLGIGPEACLARNEKLVFGRVTGWGQDGPLAQAAGHDINYIALAGALHHFGRAGEAPVPPMNLVGDFGGGGMLLALGVVAALFERSRSGKGQVVDAAMVDGVAILMAMHFALRAMGVATDRRGEGLLDTGAPFYDVYETADGGHVSIGAIEPKFYDELVKRLEVDDLPDRNNPAKWPALRERLRALFLTKIRDEWSAILEGTDACFAPVLTIPEARNHPHNTERKTFVEVEGVLQPAPAPRFSRTPSGISRRPPRPGDGGDEALRDWGCSSDEIASLRRDGVIR